MKRTVTTLSLIEKDDKILLAMKKRGFGAGWWNGYGGKIAEGETIEEAMIRELEEESGLRAKEWRKRGVNYFHFEGGEVIEVNIFEVTDYIGNPIETEEMKPRWFHKSAVPYHLMWPSDDQWFPLFLEGKDFYGDFFFGDIKKKNYLNCEVRIVDRIK